MFTKTNSLRILDAQVKEDPTLITEKGDVIVNLYQCEDCQVWWGSSPIRVNPLAHLIFRYVEPNSDVYHWDNYRGWRDMDEAHNCPECGKSTPTPAVSIR